MNRTFQLSEIPDITKNILGMINELPRKTTATIVFLQGDLGAGKTTLTQAIARELGIIETVQSPTFVILKSYQIQNTELLDNKFTNLIHIDSYRLTSGADLVKLDWENYYSNPKNLIIIEWPEIVVDVVSSPDILIKLEHNDQGTRSISI